MPEIKIKVRDKCAEGKGVVICNNSDYTVMWDLDEEWTPYDTKTMRVNLADGTYQDVVFTGDNAALPVLTASGWVSVGLYAGDLHTSRAARLLALSSVLTPGGSPAAPAEDVYAQIMAKLNELSTVSPEDIAKAVEDYLAEHPAASASMRVEGGYIQFSGDGKTWENVIALADLKGPKGDTGATGPQGPAGAGMDITGASVGQIAKIAAVDESGKPTKWGPVDIPSGGSETWELIRDFTLTDDVVQVTINLDENGKPFRLKKAYVFITATAPTDESITYAADICCSPAKESPSVWGTNTVFVGQSPAFGQSTRYTMSLWDTYGNFLLPVEIKSSDGNSTADRLVTKTRYDDAGAIVATDSGLGFLQSPCESFAFGSYRKTLFTGANIKIYGVRV